ncbi:spore coat associated protein CotJA [Pelotomaculum isophthalicicum JI]|uniref:Spore coat associated protein CotJA n=1 Tax=Pelotomaculum isophthalicicum JI TaxID=947010 RepID=A0A9X4H6Z2_9FIRM|nr:spore coat associated protein CotJA [Pelotomaculum isophthalicicum]MDF9408924.1 spore coat associated protein CotJA [Pelotomaculum isophthalicicum JI]
MPPMQLARAYVPWQKMGQVFSPAEALAHGTIFPELVSPYPG